MNLKEIKELIDMIRGTEISEIELERDGTRIRVRIGKDRPHPSITGPVLSRADVPQTEIEPANVHEEGTTETVIPEMVPGQVVVTSPMVGTFYRSSTPGEPAFVEVQSSVEKGQTLCIIEAMKLMNEIEAERKGRILKVLKEDKGPVEYGEPLFILEPLP
jgi:acetyl-CoA carboxylase biotin carboxyl carrier protein